MKLTNWLGKGILAIILTSCVTVPKDFVPDNKVVFLMQKTEYGPISYPAVPADPYTFAPSSDAVDAQRPAFLDTPRFDIFLKPGFKADSLLYRSAQAHFEMMLELPVVAELRQQLETPVTAPAPLPTDHGDKILDYSNGAQYQYPGTPQAKITLLNNGVVMILFEDGSVYQSQPDGTLFWKDAQGRQTQYVDPQSRSMMVKNGDTTYEVQPNAKALSGPKGTLRFVSDPDPQYQYTPPGPNAPLYTYFVDAQGAAVSCSVTARSGIRYDWFAAEKSLLITQGSQAVSIRSDYQKVHAVFDQKKRKAGDLLSVYLPQGLRLANLTGLSSAELNPGWPEGYIVKALGPFDIWYTAKDEKALANLKAERLSAIESKVRALTGLTGSARHVVVLPPDLNAYRKLSVRQPGEVLLWYPSGFEMLDVITLWPISVPRYDQPAGQEYFFNQEIYEILAHEYVHALIAENTGVFHPVPHWLNEGLAVWTESQQFPDAKKYWDLTFAVVQAQNRLLPWDDVTAKETGAYPVAQARIHYAQSYGLVSKLIETYGAAKIAAYVKSFRSDEDAVKTYRPLFAKVFGVSWEKALELLKPQS